MLKDNFGRQHTYLRISITERCNFRCTYCMPSEGIILSPKSHLMTADEIFEIAKTFVSFGVTKIRLTGGEPLVRKDFLIILEKLSTLNVELAISTNGVLIDQYFDDFIRLGVRKLNISLDTLDSSNFLKITRRNDFHKVLGNIEKAVDLNFKVKLNYVVKREDNFTEIIDFIKLTEKWNVDIQFIEFMPFGGNAWHKKDLISMDEILKRVTQNFGAKHVIKQTDKKNDTAKHFKIEGFKGQFGIISTVTKPFCDTCNRLRITANGKLKNCLFSEAENDLLGQLRKGNDISSIIETTVKMKSKIRGGMDTLEKFENPKLNQKNRTMIQIGG